MRRREIEGALLASSTSKSEEAARAKAEGETDEAPPAAVLVLL
jgi:hypothetical protein